MTNSHCRRPGAPRLTRVAAAIASSAFAAMLASQAQAQDSAAAPAASDAASAPAAAPKNDSMGLQSVVVTASAMQRSKLETSLSVTTIKSELIEALAPQSQAEILRLIPGMIAGEGSGPGGNSNISVRGLPITTGGSPFVQIQEDGLPTVLFGDMNFGNNDYWIRFDRSNTIEAVRGGSASTLASGAPGAVVNYITDTGTKNGGLFAYERGLGYNSNKIDFAVGGTLATGLRAHAEGFLTSGHGPRNEGFNAQKGGQIKANVTQDLPGGLGYVRLSLKVLDDQEPNYTSYPVLVNASASSFGGYSAFPGFDLRKGSTIGIYNQNFTIVDSSTGAMRQVASDGIHPKAQTIGAQIHLTPGMGFAIDDKYRYTIMSGDFSTQFQGLTTPGSIIGSTVNGQTVGSIVYANGPQKGAAFAGSYLNGGTQIYTHMRDMGSVANDLSLSKAFHTPVGRISGTGGVFYMDQTIAQDWHPNQHYQTEDGVNPAALDLVSTTGQLLTLNGVAGYNSAWGASVNRSYDLHAADTAPYLNLAWDNGPLTVEAGVREDQLKVTGWEESATDATTQTSLMSGSLVTSSTLDPSTYKTLKYHARYNSYSLGSLYLLDDDTSVFARVSRGGRFNVDRNILSGYTNADGSLTASGAQKAVSMVMQQEIGAKARGTVGAVNYGTDITLFHNTYGASNFDLTQGPTGTYYQSKYKSIGVELEGTLRIGGFNAVANLTYTDAKIVANSQGPSPSELTSSGVGNQPTGTPSLQWLLAPSYTFGDVKGGLTFVGKGRTNTNVSSPYWSPSTTVVHMNLDWKIQPKVTLGLNVHNLFNKLTTNGNIDQSSLASLQGNGTVNGKYVATGSAYNGRTAEASVNVTF